MGRPRKENLKADIVSDPEVLPAIKHNIAVKDKEKSAQSLSKKVGDSRYYLEGTKIRAEYKEGDGSKYRYLVGQFKTKEQRHKLKTDLKSKGIVVEGL